MTTSYITLNSHDPVIARDSRPFGAGIRMKSLDWPYPSVLAGSVRTALGKKHDGNFDPGTVEALKKISVHGPLPVVSSSVYFPAPKDILVNDSGGSGDETYAIRPATLLGDGEGCDLPNSELQPPMLSFRAAEEFKPATIAPFWSVDAMAAWLVNPDGAGFSAPKARKMGDMKAGQKPEGFDLPAKESRFHSAIDPVPGTASDGMLFETVGLDLSLKCSHAMMGITARIETEDHSPVNVTGFAEVHPFGGERRLSFWKSEDRPPVGWECPPGVADALTKAKFFRMVLATPALFSHGWLPGWIDTTTLTGMPPSAPENNVGKVCLKLVSACVERWKPLSGFSLEKGNEGPKPLRRVVPAGSVYFFRMESGNAGDLAKCWLCPVSDNLQDRIDGFGLAIWGIWDVEKENSMKIQRGE